MPPYLEKRCRAWIWFVGRVAGAECPDRRSGSRASSDDMSSDDQRRAETSRDPTRPSPYMESYLKSCSDPW